MLRIKKFLSGLFSSSGFVNDLRTNGYSLIPAPQNIELSGRDIVVDNSWAVETRLGGENIALKGLHSGAKELFDIEFTGKSSNKLILEVKPGIIEGFYNYFVQMETANIICPKVL